MTPAFDRLALSIVVAALAHAGCGDSTGVGGAAGGAASGGEAQGGSAQGGGSSGGSGQGGQGGQGLVVDCSGGDPEFPSFDKSCASDDDCAVRFHQTDCCGTRMAIGIRADDAHEFDIAEAVCEGQYPGCGCDAGPTLAEDGSEVASEDAVLVSCDETGACMTHE